ncbi:dihydropteroate synthase [Candidatus Aerophobetes bacterium]|nr:dihydropteroate synthase [Candidatus Aerophobetes bacterium]
MLVIGEKINTTLKEAKDIVSRKDEAALQNLAKKQIDAGANMVDVNVGTRINTEVEDMRWAIKTIQQVLDIPCCIDSPNAKALEAGLQAHKGKALVNSTTLEKERLKEFLSIVKNYDCKIVALTMDDEGIPEDDEKRYKISANLIEKFTREGFALDDIYIDPLVRPIATDAHLGIVVLQAMHKISTSFPGVHIICGLSNISFGLPKRNLLNRVFLAMAIAKGLDAALVDPLDKDLMATIISVMALLGKDEFCANYISSFREGKI